MKRCSLLLACLLVSSTAHAQGFSDRLLSAYEAGLRARALRAATDHLELQTEALREYYRQQAKLLEQQNRILQLQEQQRVAALAQQESQIEAQAAADAKAEIQQFSLRRPGWQAHERAMVLWAQKVEIGQLDYQTYLDVLYFLARRDEYDAAVRDAAREQADAVLQDFGRLYPDWKRYEPRMVELSQTVKPAPSMTDIEYMTVLYNSARRER